MKWRGCLQERIARKGTNKDHEILFEQSKNTFETAQTILNGPEKQRSKLLLLYDAVRERLEGIAVKHGYDIHNHECYKAFLKEVLNKSQLSKKFNKSRVLRNKLEYDGYQLTEQQAKQEKQSLREQYIMLRKLS